MIKSEKMDMFLKLVAGGKKLDGEVKRLKEIKPIAIKHVLLESNNDVVTLPKDKTIEEKYHDFLLEKENLKKKLTPFLNKFSQNISNSTILINDFIFRKEIEEDKHNFSSILSQGSWEKVKVPHYIGETGKWNAFYFAKITTNNINKEKEYILRFESIDYSADIYFNGRLVKTHTGFFAPFEADVTDYILEGSNDLLIVVHNDLTTNGINIEGKVSHGNKIYACTNIGYDEPKEGWHHCPAGAGIIGKIFLITSNKQRITDCFVRPNIDDGSFEAKITITNYLYVQKDIDVFFDIEGRNFKESIVLGEKKDIQTLQIGENHIEYSYNFKSFKLWTINEPYLYDLTITLKTKDGEIIDTYQTHFGMRKFHMDLNSKPYKGQFFFNNERIMLRGTNEMGHLPRAVMENNYDQLIDDILIAKVAGLNYYRMTQRPTLTQIYDYFDMLGMLCQSDFPLFSYITDGALGEAYKQVDEMERLTRNHPSVILESFCNETLDKTAWGKEQYVLSRFEIEKFFEISRGIVELLNPDRVIKYCEGDYAPLPKTYGISDFHCYTYWYISHGLPSGKLRKGYLPPLRKDYMCGCGEFGVDGLDSYELMKKYAPKEWLPKDVNDKWSPKAISKGQCYMLHGDFFPEQENILSWIEASRNFQAKAIKEYVHSLRLRSDYIQSTAVHLLIDAWPMGWSKVLVDVDRIPKPAFYEFKEASIPLRVSLRRDKFVIYKSDSANIEVYAYNDLSKDKKVKISVSIFQGEKYENFGGNFLAKSCSSTYLGDVVVKSKNGFVGDAKVVVKMEDEDGNITYDNIKISITKNNKIAGKKPLILSKSLKCINNLCEGKVDSSLIFIDGKDYEKMSQEIDDKVEKGATAFVSLNEPTTVAKKDIFFKTHTLEEEVRANNLIYPSSLSSYTKQFNILDFQNFYNKKKDYQDLSAWFKFYCDGMNEILYTLEDVADETYKYHKKHKLIMGEFAYGKGKVIVSTLSALDGCIGNNPTLDQLFINIINNQ